MLSPDVRAKTVFARLEARHGRTSRRYDAAEIVAEPMRQRVRRHAPEIAAHDLVVDGIEARGMNFDQHFTGPHDRIGNVRERDVGGDRAIAGELIGTHRNLLRRQSETSNSKYDVVRGSP